MSKVVLEADHFDSKARQWDSNPVFRELNRRAGEPSWNFNKYLMSADGKSVQRFDSDVTPDSPQLTRAVEQLLN